MIQDLFTPFQFTISSIRSEKDKVVTYQIKCTYIPVDQTFHWSTNDNLSETLKGIAVKFVGILLNGNTFSKDIIYNKELILKFIDTYYITLSPEDKLNSVLEYMSKWAKYDGQTFELKVPKAITLAKMYFSTLGEWKFYLDSAIGMDLIKRKTQLVNDKDSVSVTTYNLTVKGLSSLIKINETKNSLFGFVAMCFNDEMDVIYRDAIEVAITSTGFNPYIVNRINTKSDETINDAILAGIKKARFTIADFTYHREGVYFEAGYALGRGQKVIYTCREDHMKNAHFDIRNYQHVVWKDAADFKKKLTDKIEAFIKD